MGPISLCLSRLSSMQCQGVKLINTASVISSEAKILFSMSLLFLNPSLFGHVGTVILNLMSMIVGKFNISQKSRLLKA
jgi:hypothetical protein